MAVTGSGRQDTTLCLCVGRLEMKMAMKRPNLRSSSYISLYLRTLFAVAHQLETARRPWKLGKFGRGDEL